MNDETRETFFANELGRNRVDDSWDGANPPLPDDPAYGVNGGFPDETWDGEWEVDNDFDEYGNYVGDLRDTPQGCDGPSCPDCGDPFIPERTYVVTATIQLCINGTDGASAAIGMKDLLNDIIAESDYPQDPLNGAIIDTVDDITVDC